MLYSYAKKTAHSYELQEKLLWKEIGWCTSMGLNKAKTQSFSNYFGLLVMGCCMATQKFLATSN